MTFSGACIHYYYPHVRCVRVCALCCCRRQLKWEIAYKNRNANKGIRAHIRILRTQTAERDQHTLIASSHWKNKTTTSKRRCVRKSLLIRWFVVNSIRNMNSVQCTPQYSCGVMSRNRASDGNSTATWMLDGHLWVRRETAIAQCHRQTTRRKKEEKKTLMTLPATIALSSSSWFVGLSSWHQNGSWFSREETFQKAK